VHGLKLDGLVLVSVLAWFATEHTEEALAEPAQEATHDEEGYRNPGPDDNCACETVDVAWAIVGRGLRFVDDSVPVGEGPVGAHRVPDADEDDGSDVEESLASELAALTTLGHLAATFLEKEFEEHEDDEEESHDDEVVGDLLCPLALCAGRVGVGDVEVKV